MVLPKHIAIIMDGNGRWAKSRGLARTKGHEAGVKQLNETARQCAELEVPYLTVYAFSTENWDRPHKEVNFIMKLFQDSLLDYKEQLVENRTRVKFIGGRVKLPTSLQELMADIEETTKNFDMLNLIVAFNYGSRKEIVEAVETILMAQENLRGRMSEELFSRFLTTHNMPDVDLLIRPGGELRLSNFLLWQSAYAELYFTDVFWPDFNGEELAKALIEFNKRQRRFGGLRGEGS